MKKINSEIRLRTYPVISDAVESGIRGGYRRAFKHTDTPAEEDIVQQIHNYVMIELCELLDFGNDYED